MSRIANILGSSFLLAILMQEAGKSFGPSVPSGTEARFLEVPMAETIEQFAGPIREMNVHAEVTVVSYGDAEDTHRISIRFRPLSGFEEIRGNNRHVHLAPHLRAVSCSNPAIAIGDDHVLLYLPGSVTQLDHGAAVDWVCGKKPVGIEELRSLLTSAGRRLP